MLSIIVTMIKNLITTNAYQLPLTVFIFCDRTIMTCLPWDRLNDNDLVLAQKIQLPERLSWVVKGYYVLRSRFFFLWPHDWLIFVRGKSSMESINDDKIQKTLVTPGIGGQPTFSNGTKVSRNKKKSFSCFGFFEVHTFIIFFFRRYRFILLRELLAVTLW